MSKKQQLASTPEPQDIRPRTIGHYILGKTIGEGTFGKVKLGTHTLTNEKVAIKVLEKSRIIDVADVERVSRQIHILKLIRHPNIIQLYEIIETQKQLFLVMEYVSDGELFDYIVKRKRIKEAEACEFMQQILTGVEYLHKLNIVHRDLKPENLLIDFNKKIKLVDFGLSNTYKRNELLKTACGSPCYAAPQMIAGKKYQGLNVDIWSCGVILFAMICGYLPFEDPNTSALYKKILAGDYSIPKFVTPEARQLLKGILTIDPDKRYTLKDIRNHRWLNQTKAATTCQGVIVGFNRIPVDFNVLNILKQYQFDIQASRKCIQSNRHNHLTTTYYLLLKKNLKAGQPSQADICSQCFDKSLIEQLPKKKQKKQDSTNDEMDLDSIDVRRRKIQSQIGKRSSNLSQDLANLVNIKTNNSTIQSQNLPIVNNKEKTRKTINRFTIRSKKNTLDVDLYDFEDFVNNKPGLIMKSSREQKERPKDQETNNILFNRTNALFKPRQRYGVISRGDDSIESGRRISVKQTDMNRTFRVTKNTFQPKQRFESIDVKTSRNRARIDLAKRQSERASNSVNIQNFQRLTHNNFY